MQLNIVIPMAGRGSRFSEQGYALPKPLIEIHGKAMIQLVINNLKPSFDHRFIFLCLKNHLEEYQIEDKLKQWCPSCEIITVDQVTEGAACTVLLAKEFINSNDPLMIANSDQWVDINIDQYLEAQSEMDGLIMTMTADDPKWSFIRLNGDNQITEVVEKQVVSNEATVGIYNFQRGADYVRSAESMIEQDLRVNNEFYVAPVYNELIKENKQIGYFNIGAEAKGMYGLGIPDDLKLFEQLPVSKKAASFS